MLNLRSLSDKTCTFAMISFWKHIPSTSPKLLLLEVKIPNRGNKMRSPTLESLPKKCRTYDHIPKYFWTKSWNSYNWNFFTCYILRHDLPWRTSYLTLFTYISRKLVLFSSFKLLKKALVVFIWLNYCNPI